MDISTILTHTLPPLLVGLVAYFGGRRLNKSTIAVNEATADEKQANTIKLLTDSAEGMARQLRAFEAEVPVWKTRITEESKRADEAEQYNNMAREIQTQAAIIAEHVSHISYWQIPGEPEDPMARRVREMKAAGRVIENLKLPERVTLVHQTGSLDSNS